MDVLEQRYLLCGLPHEELIAPPDWSEALEHASVAARAADRDDSPEVPMQEPTGATNTDIIWANRGMASDGFAANFGTSAEPGRLVIDAVLNYWEHIITDWNRPDATTTLQVNFSIAASNGFGAAGAPGGATPADGKPRTGSITINRGNNSGDANDSNGWFFDPTPYDNSEFLGTILNAYAGVDSAGNGSDLFSVASAELVHVLGLISDKTNDGASWNGYLLESSGFATNTGIADNAEGGGNGVFWAFDGPTIDHLMTSYNSGDANATSWGNIVHSAGVGNINFNSVNWVGSEDSGNASYGNERTFPSYVMTNVLKDAYGYTVRDPEEFGHFHAVLNETTNELIVRGGEGTSADNIVLEMVGGKLRVSVDVGNDVAGTGPLPGAGNIDAYVTDFALADVSSISIQGRGGADVISIHSLDSGLPVIVDPGDGADTIHIADAGENLDVIDSSITLQTSPGDDLLFLHDTANAFGDTFTITPTTIVRPFFSILTYSADDVRIDAGPGNNTFDISVPSSGTDFVINADGGSDVFNLSASLIAGSTQLELFGQTGDDTFNIHPSPSAEVTADGGAHTLGDRLNLKGDGLEYDFDNNDFSAPTRQDVNYLLVETIALENGVYEAIGTINPDVFVDNGAVLTGAGTLTGNVTALSGGTIAPGITYPISTGILGTGNLALNAGSTYSVDLNGLVAGTGHDQLDVTGTVTLAGNLTGTLGAAVVPGDEIVIIHNAGVAPVVGTFAQGAMVVIGGQEFAIDYAHDADGDGQFNDVALIAFGAALAPDPCDPSKQALFVSGTTGDDDIRFVKVQGNSLIKVLINGVDEGNFSPGGLLIAFGQSGNDTIIAQVPSRESWLYGQGGNDVLRTGNNDSMLNGGDGDDELSAGNGKDILIGGRGADTANGGNGSDLLIAGWTDYDTNNAANREAICHIQEEWLHGPGGWKGHIDHLTNGGGLSAPYVLNSTTVFDDLSTDILRGGNGKDWFLLNIIGGTALDTSDADKNEVETDI